MDPSPSSDEFYNDSLAISRTGNVNTAASAVGPTVGPVTNVSSNSNLAVAAPGTADQRWPYGLPTLSAEHAKHPSTFEPDCSTPFSGLPPLSQAFNAYPPSYPSRLASGNGFMETPYMPHTMAMAHRTAPTASAVPALATSVASTPAAPPAPSFTYPSAPSNEMHNYFGNRSEELFTPAPPFIHPTGTPSTPGTLSGAPLGTAGSALNAPTVPGSNVPGMEPRLPINGQPHRLSAYSSASLVHPTMGSPVPMQHFWPNFALHNPAVSDRTSNNNNGFQPPSPVGVTRPVLSTAGVSTAPPSAAPPPTLSSNLNANLSSGLSTGTTNLPMPYKAPNKVKQIYSFVPLPGAQTQKRPRRRYDEIERIYQCGWNGCEKAYGTLNHLNAHVFMQGHGEKRTPDEFKEIRAVWRAKKKEEIKKKQAEDQMRQEEQKRHTLPSPQLSQQLSSLSEPQQTLPSNMSHVVYTHLPQSLPNIYPYPPQQTSLQESSHSHTYSTSTYHTSILPHLNQYTAHPQPYTNSNRDYKSHAEDEDRDAEGEPDPEASG